MRLGVFDSGVGGLYVVRAIREQRPDVDILYFGDVAHLPYGSRSAETVIRLTRNAVKYLIENDVEQIIIGCNTASSVALEILRQEFDIPIHGVIEPTTRAISNTSHRTVGLIGTRGTILSGAYQKSLKEKMPRAVVYPLACPLFVPLVEEGWLFHPLTKSIVKATLAELPMQEIHALILGCTHYPSLLPILSDLFQGLLFVDPARCLANELASILTGGNSRLDLVVTDMTPQLQSLASAILGKIMPPKIERIVIDY